VGAGGQGVGRIEFETQDASDPGVGAVIEVQAFNTVGDLQMNFELGDAGNLVRTMQLGTFGGVAFSIDESAVASSSRTVVLGTSAERGTLHMNADSSATAGSRLQSYIQLEQFDGSGQYLWVDNSAAVGDFRIHSVAPTEAGDTTGTVVGTQTFTGFHFYPSNAIVDAANDDGYDGYLAVGDVVVLDDGYVVRTSTSAQKNVVGIFCGFTTDYRSSLTGDTSTPDTYYEQADGKKILEDGYYIGYDPAKSGVLFEEGDTVTLAVVASLGDARDFSVSNNLRGFSVCDEGGAISSGDLLCSSSTYGYLMKQSDDIMRSSTVGKALEDVTFDGDGKATEVYGYIYCG
jgi:hypothetical protein